MMGLRHLGSRGIIRPYAIAGFIGWTLLIIAIAAYDVHEHDQEAMQILHNEANAAIAKDLVYRRWSTETGGVYAEVSETLQPSPLLADYPERDVVTPSGRMLTLVSPSHLTREVHRVEQNTGVLSHLTSLSPLRGENQPDEWEREALEKLERGFPEVSSIESLNDGRYFRLMRPLIAEQECLGCHRDDAHEIGDVMGGISVSVPYRSFFELFDESLSERLTVFGSLWLIGCGLILFGSVKIASGTDALRESEQKYRNLFNSMRDGMYRTDSEGRIVFINTAGARLLGYEYPDQARGEYFASRWENPTERMTFTGDLRTNGSITLRQVRIRTLKGTVSTMEMSSTILMDDAGNQVYEEGVFRDISSRVAANQKVQEMYRMMQGILEHAPFGIYLLDANGTIEYANPAILRLGPEAAERFSVRNIFELFDERYPNLSERIREGIRGREFVLEDIACEIGNGNAPLVCNLFGIPLEEQGHRKLLLFLENMTDHVQAEQRQQELQEQLRQTQKIESLGRLAGGVAHDINNVLSVIIGYCDLAIYDAPEDSQLSKNLLTIRQAGDKAASIVQQLLAFSRKQVLEMKVLEIDRVIAGIATMLERLLGENVKLRVSCSAEGATVYGDSTQIEQILINLAVNARDAMPQGGNITVSTDKVIYIEETVPRKEMPPGHYLRLEVADTGEGMDAETVSKIFEPFFTTKAEGDGTGLGLATVFGIVKQHNGFIYVDSTPGTGTVFDIFFPVVQGKVKAVESPGTLAPMPRGNATILVVEDDLGMRELMAKVLASVGHTVLQAENGPEALRTCEEFSGNIDILLTDIVMPMMNGPELANLVRSKRPETKVVYVSGYTDDVIQQYGILEKETAYLRKPISPSVLAGKIAEVSGGGGVRTRDRLPPRN